MTRKKWDTADGYYFPFYARDWRSSEGVRLMSLEQRGAFIELLSVAWLASEEPCSIPPDDEEIAALLNVPVVDWKRLAPRVLAEFDETTSSGRLRNQKLWKIYQSLRTAHRKMTQGGKTSALRRRDEHGRLLPATIQAPGQAATKHPGKVASGNQNQNQNQIKDIGGGAPAPRPAQFPDFPKTQCDALYAVWSRFGNPPYPSFRKALGPVLSGPDRRQFEDVKVGMEEAIRRAESDEKQAGFLNIHTFAQKVGYWIGEAKGRPVVDPSSGTLRRAI